MNYYWIGYKGKLFQARMPDRSARDYDGYVFVSPCM